MADYLDMQEEAEVMSNIVTVIANIVAFMEDEYETEWVTVESSKRQGQSLRSKTVEQQCLDVMSHFIQMDDRLFR